MSEHICGFEYKSERGVEGLALTRFEFILSDYFIDLVEYRDGLFAIRTLLIGGGGFL